MKKIKFAIASTFIIIFITAIFAFAAEVKNTLPSIPPAPVNVVPATLQTQIQQPPPLAPTPENTYSYNPLGKPDPFRPFVEVDIVAKKDERKEIASIFPLQRAETENFRVVGIGGDNIRRVAVVEDATKKYYPLFTGTHIGLHNGKVIEIMHDRVIVEEYGTKNAKRIILKLRKN
jgi:type IV pilus assembly protein PilP